MPPIRPSERSSAVSPGSLSRNDPPPNSLIRIRCSERVSSFHWSASRHAGKQPLTESGSGPTFCESGGLALRRANERRTRVFVQSPILRRPRIRMGLLIVPQRTVRWDRSTGIPVHANGTRTSGLPGLVQGPSGAGNLGSGNKCPNAAAVNRVEDQGQHDEPHRLSKRPP
jgi:hypothetical protein